MKKDRSKEVPNKEEVEILGPEMSYADLIDFGTEKLIEKDNSFRGMPLRPSAAGKCEKELGYEFMEFRGYAEFPPEKREPSVHRLLSLGHAVESNFIWNIKKAMGEIDPSFRIKYAQQVLSFGPLPSGEMLEGSLDSVFISDKFKALVDYKTKKNKWSNYYKDDWEATAEKLRGNAYTVELSDGNFYIFDLDKYLESTRKSDPFTAMNFYQLNFYFHDEHKFLQSRGINHCVLLYYNKNDSRIREIRFKPSEAVAKYVKDKYVKIQSKVDETKDTSKLKKEFTLGSVKCAFCRFRDDCWGDKDTLKAYFDTFPNKRWPRDTHKLPEAVGSRLEELYSEYVFMDTASSKMLEIEQEILKILDKERIFKVRFSDEAIYELKTYKTGGVANGPRMALKRSKL